MNKPSKLDLTGRKSGQLTVLGFSHSDGIRTYWNCVCSCGNTVTFASNKISRSYGARQFCGNKCPDFLKFISKKHKTHGMTNHPAYRAWQRHRISFCQEWRESFEAFWRDMGPSYRPKSALRRFDESRSFEAGNCYWEYYLVVPDKIQAAAKLLGIGRTTLRYRLARGCPEHLLLSPPDATRKFDIPVTRDTVTTL